MRAHEPRVEHCLLFEIGIGMNLFLYFYCVMGLLKARGLYVDEWIPTASLHLCFIRIRGYDSCPREIKALLELQLEQAQHLGIEKKN